MGCAGLIAVSIHVFQIVLQFAERSVACDSPRSFEIGVLFDSAMLAPATLKHACAYLDGSMRFDTDADARAPWQCASWCARGVCSMAHCLLTTRMAARAEQYLC